MNISTSYALGLATLALLTACTDGPTSTPPPPTTASGAENQATTPVPTPYRPAPEAPRTSTPPAPGVPAPQPEHFGSVTFTVRATGATSPIGYTVNYSLTAPSGCLPVYGCIGFYEFEFAGDTFTGEHLWLADVYFYLTPWNRECQVTSPNPVRITVDEWRPNDVAFTVGCP